jgi:hypothetical protein
LLTTNERLGQPVRPSGGAEPDKGFGVAANAYVRAQFPLVLLLGRIRLYPKFGGRGAQRVVKHDSHGLIGEPAHDVESVSQPLRVGSGAGTGEVRFCGMLARLIARCAVFSLSARFRRFESTSARILSRSAAVSASQT